jgi:hypothetical protein
MPLASSLAALAGGPPRRAFPAVLRPAALHACSYVCGAVRISTEWCMAPQITQRKGTLVPPLPAAKEMGAPAGSAHARPPPAACMQAPQLYKPGVCVHALPLAPHATIRTVEAAAGGGPLPPHTHTLTGCAIEGWSSPPHADAQTGHVHQAMRAAPERARAPSPLPTTTTPAPPRPAPTAVNASSVLSGRWSRNMDLDTTSPPSSSCSTPIHRAA